MATIAVLAALVALPHVALGYVVVHGYTVLDTVFADEEPGDVLSANGPSSSYRRSGASRGTSIHLRSDRYVPSPSGSRDRTAAPDVPLASGPWIVDDEAEARMLPWVTLLLLGSDEARDRAATEPTR